MAPVRKADYSNTSPMHLMDLIRRLDDDYAIPKSPLWNCMSKSNHLRAIFDPLCAEWNWLQMDEKLGILRQFMTQTSFEVIVESYCMTERREYVIQEVPEAIYILAKHLPEAAEYYLRSSRCQNHWRRAGEPNLEEVLNKASDIADRNLNNGNNREPALHS